jgi:hypothetical protein
MTSLTPYRRTPRQSAGRGGRVGLRLLWGLFLLLLLALLLAGPAAALDTVYLVRHAEKADWPTDRGIAAVYTSRTTRTLQTGNPLAHATGVPISADDATTKPDEMVAFLTRLREKHAADKAVLIVGHSNTVPELLLKFGAKADCFQKLGITGQPGSLLIEGYEGVWKVDLKKQGCEGMERE